MVWKEEKTTLIFLTVKPYFENFLLSLVFFLINICFFFLRTLVATLTLNFHEMEQCVAN